MTVSVVIPSYRGAEKLPIVIAALATQRNVEVEVIVVLDGVVDDSPSILAEWADRLRLQVVTLPENRGRPAALNAGFAVATGDVLIRCDDDLQPPPNFAATHAAHHAGEPVGVVGMCPDVFDDTPYARVYGRKADVNVRRMAHGMPAIDRWRLWSANVSVTRDTFERVGGYDERFRAYGWEDIDWGFRLAQLGIPIIVPTDVEAVHFGPALSVRDRAAKAFASGEARRTFAAKHPGALSGDGVHHRRTPWNLLVGGVASAYPRHGDAVAARVDQLLGHVPAWVGTKLASAVVEGAGRAGSSDRSPQVVSTPVGSR